MRAKENGGCSQAEWLARQKRALVATVQIKITTTTVEIHGERKNRDGGVVIGLLQQVYAICMLIELKNTST
jgi:hypothetical protein